MIALGAITVLVPLGYMFVTADQTTLRVVAAQHLMGYAILWAGVPWALGLVSNEDGGVLVAASAAAVTLLGSLGLGTLKSRPKVTMAAAFWLVMIALTWYTHLSVFASFGVGAVSFAWALSASRT